MCIDQTIYNQVQESGIMTRRFPEFDPDKVGACAARA